MGFWALQTSIWILSLVQFGGAICCFGWCFLSRLQIPTQLLNTETRKGNVMFVTVRNIGTSVDELDTTNQIIKLTRQKRNCTFFGPFLIVKIPAHARKTLSLDRIPRKQDTPPWRASSVPLTSLEANLKLRYAIGTFRLGSLVFCGLPDLWWSHVWNKKRRCSYHVQPFCCKFETNTW